MCTCFRFILHMTDIVYIQVGPVAMWREMLPAGVGVGIAMAIVSAIGSWFL